jgi:pteridine reductase
MTDSKSKIALLTGASQRVGKYIAMELAKSGYTVHFTYKAARAEARQTLRELQVFSPDSKAFQCDVSKVVQIKRLFKDFSKTSKRLDLLICLASNFYQTPLPNVTEKDFDALVGTNLKGTFFTMQEAARLMAKQSFTSRIITFSDVSAELVWRNYAPYTAAKLGIQHFTKIFAKVFAPKILVNSIAPGTVLLNPKADAKYAEQILQKVPLGKIGSPEDIFAAVKFLAESKYVTGQIINVDGGRLLY